MERSELDNHQRPIWDDAYEKGREAGRDELAEALHSKPKSSGERRAFIRDAAVRLCVAHRSRDEVWQMSHSDVRVIWDAAVMLWNGKPEDC